MTKPTLDPRRHAYRDDLAAQSLRRQIAAPRYVAGEVRQVVRASAGLWTRPTPLEGWATEALHGELVTVYDERDGLAWVQLAHDNYVGYVAADALSAAVQMPTHRVVVPGTFRYAAADAKALTGLHLTLNALVRVEDVGTSFARLADGGYVPTPHLAEIGTFADDFVAVAERFIGTPYVWGGKTRLGLDCSGLVQTAMHAAGLVCPRDSDMQRAELGTELEVREDLGGLKRGDLIFWKGHVGLLADPVTLLHANATHMAVAAEPLRGAVERIAKSGSPIAAIKRIGSAHV
ncbi:MAG TPA: NlpC/P60 family protein [Hyphomicrobiaceae bacterium]|nr:NlpC/P60 family protein [Hyphomicrobiaceae bacterium]